MVETPSEPVSQAQAARLLGLPQSEISTAIRWLDLPTVKPTGSGRNGNCNLLPPGTFAGLRDQAIKIGRIPA